METVFIGRQPLFTIDEEIFAYELLFRTSKRTNTAKITNQKLATAQVLHYALNGFGLEELLDGRKAFLNAGREFLFDRCIEALPADQFYLEIDARSELDSAMIDRIRQLKRRGYRFSIDDIDMTDAQLHRFKPLFEMADLAKVDMMTADMDTLDVKLGFFQQYGMEVMAERVETAEVLVRCQELGFDYVQGYHFARPEVLEAPKIEPVQLGLIELIENLLQGCDDTVVEEAFAHDPKLTLLLLHYVNTSLFTGRTEISSIKQALGLVGREPLLHWLRLVLYAGTSEQKKKQPFLHTTMLRGELMADMAKRYRLGATMRDKAYFVGVISLMPTFLKLTAEEFVKTHRFDKEIADAVLNHRGRLGKLLHLVTLFELAHFPTTQTLLERIGMNEKELYALMHEAYDRVAERHAHLL